MQHTECDENMEVLWEFKGFLSHQGPLSQNHPNYKGFSYNGTMKWENGEVTTEPLSIIAADDSVSCVLYAKDNDLLDLPSWEWLRNIS